MYESHFELRERPFAAAPLTACYVPVASIEHARQGLARCAERAEGIGLVIGSAGTGKTLLCQLLADHFRQQQFQVALLASARLPSRRALLQNILFELGLPYRAMDEEELRLSLIDHLTPRGGAERGLVLIVDEAHTLPLKLLEEVRLVGNILHGGQPRVRLVLAGAPAMEERLASPRFDSLNQRIASRCYLIPLNREETAAYVRAQFARVGGKVDVIAPEPVLKAIQQASDGIPRLINQVCDHALILAALDGQKVLTPRRIEQAWADLQQLPAPWHETPKTPLAETAGGIEFGQLDEPAPAETRIEIPSGDPLGYKALEELEEIDHSLRAIAEESSPVMEPSDRDPQGLFGHYDEEEVVIDRYASLETRVHPLRARVACPEGREIGQALRGGNEPVHEPVTPVRLLDADDEQECEGTSGLTSGDDHPSDDPVLPETDEPPRCIAALAEDGGSSDDRDLILVQGDDEAFADPRSASKRRRRYRQLFSSLRRG